ncbi:MAG TPA: phenylalanine--tRNA ligase beta subunit-related protein [Nannocystaceae bacterium]|nr:phenylalanine--tRNA ligase beta subunit-related protein [Nannocystaceae bacterium]
MDLVVAPHPLLQLGAFVARFPAPIGALPSPAWLVDMLRLDAELRAQGGPRLASDETIRGAVRRLLRHGGYKPSGRGKPASEYLLGAATEGTLGSINLPVDLCNAASLHSGLPISVVDLDRAQPPLSVAIPPEKTTYVFNASGQSIDLTGLLCLHDAEGPCANAVKDAQRTKTNDATTQVVCIVWGSNEIAARCEATLACYRELTERAGATTSNVELR